MKLANLRAVEAAEFRFQPGFNLIVGVNGVGKSSALDALRVCVSAVVRQANRLRAPMGAFAVDDIRVGAAALSVECSVIINSAEHSYLIHKPREASVSQAKKTGMPREQVHETPEKAMFIGGLPTLASGTPTEGRPLAVLFSTNRAVPSERAPSSGASAGGIAAAFADALTSRELRLGEFAAWMRVQEALKKDRTVADRVLAAFESAVVRFLPGYANLRVSGDDRPRLLIDRGSTTVPVRQLSDGERGTLALVLDLTRRLSQANPEMGDPAAQAEAVVLVDEIDLHLHPRWQRQVVRNLTAAFPLCQFIATTHSPLVIGEVEHDRIQIIADGKVHRPTHSLGIDSSRVLEEIMDTPARSREMVDQLLGVNQAIGAQDFNQARERLRGVASRLELGENDPEVSAYEPSSISWLVMSEDNFEGSGAGELDHTSSNSTFQLRQLWGQGRPSSCADNRPTRAPVAIAPVASTMGMGP